MPPKMVAVSHRFLVASTYAVGLCLLACAGFSLSEVQRHHLPPVVAEIEALGLSRRRPESWGAGFNSPPLSLRIAFTLADRGTNVTWDFRRAVEPYLRGALAELAGLVDLSIDSQVLHNVEIPASPSSHRPGSCRVVLERDARAFLGATGRQLGSMVDSRVSTLHLVLCVGLFGGG